MGTACYVRGGQNVLDSLSDDLKVKSGETTKDGEFTLVATRCIGACGLAPVFSVGDEIFGNASVAKAKQVLKELREALHEAK